MGVDMVELAGGSFRMGSTAFYPGGSPVIEATVGPFAIDRAAVTNREFARFVDETGYLTVTERELDPADFPGADNLNTAPSSLVFTPMLGPVTLGDWRQWWRWVTEACWRTPAGPDSMIDGRMGIRSSRSASRTRRATPNGQGRNCRRRQNGNSRHAAVWTARLSSGVRSRRARDH